MKKSILFLILGLILSLSSCGSVNDELVSIKSIDAKLIEYNEEDIGFDKKSVIKRKHRDDIENTNYIVTYKSETDITFTVNVDKPRDARISALQIKCDDENAKILIDNNYEPISMDADGTRTINWAAESAYKCSYNIRVSSEEFINTLTVVDVWLEGHEKSQVEESKNKDLGNNELQIYKLDDDAFSLNIIENTFEKITYNFKVKDAYKDILSNFKVDGKNPDAIGNTWTVTENKDVLLTYNITGKDGILLENSKVISLVLLKPYFSMAPDAIVYSIWAPGDTFVETHELTFGFDGISHEHLKLYYGETELEVYKVTKYGISFFCGDDNFGITEMADDIYPDLSPVLELITLEINGRKYKLVYNIIFSITDEEAELTGFPKNKYNIVGIEEIK